MKKISLWVLWSIIVVWGGHLASVDIWEKKGRDLLIRWSTIPTFPNQEPLPSKFSICIMPPKHLYYQGWFQAWERTEHTQNVLRAILLTTKDRLNHLEQFLGQANNNQIWHKAGGWIESSGLDYVWVMPALAHYNSLGHVTERRGWGCDHVRHISRVYYNPWLTLKQTSQDIIWVENVSSQNEHPKNSTFCELPSSVSLLGGQRMPSQGHLCLGWDLQTWGPSLPNLTKVWVSGSWVWPHCCLWPMQKGVPLEVHQLPHVVLLSTSFVQLSEF